MGRAATPWSGEVRVAGCRAARPRGGSGPAPGRAPVPAGAYLVGSPARAGCLVARLALQVSLNRKASQLPRLLVAPVPATMVENSPPLEAMLSNAPNADVRMA